MSEFSSQAKAVAIAPKFTSFLSMIGSGFIVVDVLRKAEKVSTHHRLLVGMSFCDFFVSFWFFLTTWPIPEWENVYLASGNYPVCIAQGFFSQFSLTVAFYNSALSIYYLLVVRYGWTPERIRLRVEPLLHAVSLTIGLATATMGIALNLYNNDHWECWISPFPLDCKESWKNGGETDCIRGDNATLYRWLFYYMFLWMAIAIVTVNMVLVYQSVRSDERKVEEIADNEQAKALARRRQHSKQVAIQGYWYCGAFYLTWILPTITRLVQVINGEAPYKLVLFAALFIPFQGFFNLLVYTMPRYTHRRSLGQGLSPTEEGYEDEEGEHLD